MPDYRRNRVLGGAFFFTMNLPGGDLDLLVLRIDWLRDAVRRARQYHFSLSTTLSSG
jgi:putative transposase